METVQVTPVGVPIGAMVVSPAGWIAVGEDHGPATKCPSTTSEDAAEETKAGGDEAAEGLACIHILDGNRPSTCLRVIHGAHTRRVFKLDVCDGYLVSSGAEFRIRTRSLRR